MRRRDLCGSCRLLGLLCPLRLANAVHSRTILLPSMRRRDLCGSCRLLGRTVINNCVAFMLSLWGWRWLR